MSHFYGTVQGARRMASRCGSKRSGVVTYATGWSGAVRVEVHHDAATGKDHWRADLVPWEGAGPSQHIGNGVLGTPKVRRK